MAHSVIRGAAIFLVAIGGKVDIDRPQGPDRSDANDPKRTPIKLGRKWLGADSRSLRAVSSKNVIPRSSRFCHRRPRGAPHEIDEIERVRRLRVAAPSDMLVRAN